MISRIGERRPEDETRQVELNGLHLLLGRMLCSGSRRIRRYGHGRLSALTLPTAFARSLSLLVMDAGLN